MHPLLLARFAQSTAALVLAGTLGLRLLAWQTDAIRAAPRWQRLAWGCWGLTVLAGAGVLGWTAAEMAGETLAETLRDGSLAAVLTGTRFGAACQARAGLLVGVFAVNGLAGLRPWQDRPRVLRALDAVNLLLAAALLVTLVWTSHAQASASRAWLWPVNIVHVLAAGAWPGGLLPLAILLARARRLPALLPAAAAVTRRFSWMSALAVAVLAFSGLVNAAGTLGTPGALWSSRYGRLLLCKVALFVAMVGLGFVNRRLVKQEPSVGTVRRLSLNVGWECVLGVGVLLATEALATSEPPHG